MNTTFHSTWRSDCGTYTLHLERGCFDEMLHLARQHFPNEVGTALVGTYSDDGYSARVTGLAPLTVDSRGGRSTFRRGTQGLFEFFRDLFQSSGGMTHYVGDWHSHPGGAPYPSGTDDANAMATARAPESRCPECIQVILAIDDKSAACRAFVYSRSRGRIDLSEGAL